MIGPKNLRDSTVFEEYLYALRNPLFFYLKQIQFAGGIHPRPHFIASQTAQLGKHRRLLRADFHFSTRDVKTWWGPPKQLGNPSSRRQASCDFGGSGGRGFCLKMFLDQMPPTRPLLGG